MAYSVHCYVSYQFYLYNLHYNFIILWRYSFSGIKLNLLEISCYSFTKNLKWGTRTYIHIQLLFQNNKLLLKLLPSFLSLPQKRETISANSFKHRFWMHELAPRHTQTQIGIWNQSFATNCFMIYGVKITITDISSVYNMWI